MNIIIMYKSRLSGGLEQKKNVACICPLPLPPLAPLCTIQYTLDSMKYLECKQSFSHYLVCTVIVSMAVGSTLQVSSNIRSNSLLGVCTLVGDVECG